jgi:hypothetical protein
MEMIPIDMKPKFLVQLERNQPIDGRVRMLNTHHKRRHSKYHYDDLQYCKIVKITNNLIKEKPFQFQNVPNVFEQAVTDKEELKPLYEIWNEAGFNYDKNSQNTIRQIIVEFPHKHLTTSLKKYYSFPADQVYRVHDDTITATDTQEKRILMKAFHEFEWTCEDNRLMSLLSHLKQALHQYHPNHLPLHSTQYHPLTGQENVSKITRNMRQAFRAKDGYILLSADYCQIELRILAHYSNDQQLCEAFYPLQSDKRNHCRNEYISTCDAPGDCGDEVHKRHESIHGYDPHNNRDIFRQIAFKWLKKRHYNDITVEDRDIVKQICYANLYGSGNVVDG